jgi:hypothetical protein
MTPPVFVSADDPDALARKRNDSNAPMLGAHAAATLNALCAVNKTKETHLRPYTSERGAQNRGHRANSNTKNDRPSVAISSDTSKRCTTLWIPLEYAELADITANVDRVWRTAVAHLRVLVIIVQVIDNVRLIGCAPDSIVLVTDIVIEMRAGERGPHRGGALRGVLGLLMGVNVRGYEIGKGGHNETHGKGRKICGGDLRYGWKWYAFS